MLSELQCSGTEGDVANENYLHAAIIRGRVPFRRGITQTALPVPTPRVIQQLNQLRYGSDHDRAGYNQCLVDLN